MIYVQGPDGLIPVASEGSSAGGAISKDQIISLLGYEPASKQDIQSYIDEAILGGAW